ncbi:MAG: AMMECR1 domain-containing protein [Candidatus Adiutrix sp.]|nr:AMMECR1 domain-containing protein [Candidatus Adiutrix sp.]
MLGLLIACTLASPLLAQNQETASPAVQAPPPLSGPQKHTLLQIARESIQAALEARGAREAQVEPRLTWPQPMVVSLYVDGRLRARAWRLKGFRPLYLEARDLTFEAVAKPKISAQPFSPEELGRAEISLSVLGGFTQVNDDREVPRGAAVIIYNGFTEWPALPEDVASDQAADLLTFACEQAGLRPHAWLLPQTTIFTATVEQSRETLISVPGFNR